MKRFLKKTICVAISLCFALSFTACGPQVVEFDTTKTQIFVGNYDGGLGDAWLKKVAAEFEKDYADYELGDKKGVEIVIDSQKDKFDGNNLMSTITGNSNELFFTEKVDLPSYITRNYIADIDDVVKGDLGTLNGCASESGKTIEDKILVNKDYLKGSDGHYYGLPFYEGYYSLIYNVDLFNELKLYFKEGFENESSLEDKFVTTLTESRSEGPDGISGTSDDGLPETYEDFYDLCDYIVLNDNTKAITYPGRYIHYWRRFMFNIWANNEGADQMSLNVSLDGTATDLIDVSASGVVTPLGDRVINNDNAELLQKQKGKYQALQFIKQLAENTQWFPTNVNSLTQSRAQENFVIGTYESSMENVAMILDGTWFGSEAKGVIADAKSKYTAFNANYAVMALPKATRADVAAKTKSTFFGTNDSFCFINKNAPSLSENGKLDLVKKFLMYCHTDKCLSIFTEEVSMARPFDYSAEGVSLTPYAASVYDTHNNSDFVYPYSSNAYVRANSGSSGVFGMDNWAFSTTTTEGNYDNPFTAFKGSSVSVESYFNGMYERQRRALNRG
ncbi:MAG: hypothetical protein IJS67_03000 [Clostridia bacterium]|nr:hypothetical protein [Clostridia bacterium]